MSDSQYKSGYIAYIYVHIIREGMIANIIL